MLQIAAESAEVHTADINMRESGAFRKRAAIIVPDRSGWYGTWQVFDILCRRSVESQISGVMDLGIFDGNSLPLQWVLEEIPERASCELTNIVYYNPLSDADLMHLQPLQQKTQKQIHWIVIFPEFVLLNQQLTTSSGMRIRSPDSPSVCCLMDVQHAFNMWQRLFAHMSIVFPASTLDVELIPLWREVVNISACQVTRVQRRATV